MRRDSREQDDGKLPPVDLVRDLESTGDTKENQDQRQHEERQAGRGQQNTRASLHQGLPSVNIEKTPKISGMELFQSFHLDQAVVPASDSLPTMPGSYLPV